MTTTHHEYRAQTADARQILLAMGMGQFNATMVIPYLFIAPATTDGDMAQIQILVAQIQKKLNGLGAQLAITGRLDAPTVGTLERNLGPNWVRASWYEVCRALVAKSAILQRPSAPSRGRAQALSGFGAEEELGFVDGLGLDLPELPGGGLTYLVLGALGYHYFMKRRAKHA